MVEPRPIPESQWVADDAAPNCMICSNQFTCWVRRHHCRFCGKVLCYQCSSKVVAALRSCNSCHEQQLEAAKRKASLRSPMLARVAHLSPLVQFDAKTDGKIMGSPRVERSIDNLQRIYGSPADGKKSPILSRNLPSAGGVERKRRPIHSRPTAVPETDVMIVVDPFSTGAVLVAEILSRGCKVIRVLSDDFPDHILNLVLEGVKLEYIANVQHKGRLEDTIKQLQALAQEKTLAYLGCTPGCETGVELSDAISEALGLRSNGTRLSDHRRNKYTMQEKIREAGIRAVRQTKASTIEEVQQFLAKAPSHGMKLVVKPVASAGSDNVFVCRSPDEVRQRFNQIVGATNIFGKKNVQVVIQEFLEGKEYVVDTVSRDGVHKVITIWEYDKRPCNGAEFIYYGLRLKSVDDPHCQALVAYQKQVLDALEIKNGAGHGEVMLTPTGPCLVEVGARPHGAEGMWVPLVNKCLGTSQVKAVVDVFLDPDAFYALPDAPRLTEWYGCEVDLVSMRAGILKALPKLAEVRELKSFFDIDMFVKPGEKLVKTIDCITTPGSIRLCSRNRDQIEADFVRIHEMELDDFFILEGDDDPRDEREKPRAEAPAVK